MKKWIFSVALIFSLDLQDIKFQKMIAHGHQVVPGIFRPSENQYLRPETVQSAYLAVKGMKMEKFSGENLEKLNSAFSLV